MTILRYILIITAILLTASCASDSTIEETAGVKDELPMVFGTTFAQQETVVAQQKAPVTRGASELQSDFKVSTWKNFGRQGQQTVMEGYKVNYDATAAPYKWDYVDVLGQPQRYWDLAAYPYEFRAVAPYMQEAMISDQGLTVSLTDHYFQAQTLKNDVYNVSDSEGEPFVVAHVSRQQKGSSYEDRDQIKDKEINADAKANAVREVHMPFHHLISKVGFRLFIDDPQPSSPDYRVWLKSVEISVVNSNNSFVTASRKYTASNAQGLGCGSFSENSVASGAFVLVKHGEYTGKNLRENLNRETAFDLTPTYLQQIPQGNIKIRVQITMQTDHVVNGTVDDSSSIVYDKLLSLDKSQTEGDAFSWAPDTRYVYYLHIPNLYAHDIFLDTCEILPWDEVQTSEIIVEL